ncbi:peptidoglycan D,D-transpeptidase FtsI family protein [Microlunatus flavus]|uniref:Cell division protein FtsI (Penicillin-binding protein 3) n=1 Tax=Microlunatus flavus TaxID=1036181 RepID=A0A1H9HFT3_9ACTN|nr:penicillin-binding protein 2 [Microlunatus flavus]SEQ61157.1 cell division protein FtsI (penicillin-binding protein 3) [Microlunatus flavus]
MPQRRPHPAAGRTSRTDASGQRTDPARRRPAGSSGSSGEAHRRGERILRDGSRERPRTQSAPRPAATRSGAGGRAPAKARTAPQRRPVPRTPLTAIRVPLGSSTHRVHVVLVIMAMGLSLCAGRLLQLQGFDSARYTADSIDALTRTLPLLPARGEITDRNGQVLASTQPAVAVTADPTLVGPKAQQVAGILAPYLQMTPEQLVPLLTKPDTHFVYLKKKVPALTYTNLAADLAKAGIYGVFRESDPIRTYPDGAVGSSVVGFVGADGKGLGGLELSMNKELSGVEGTETYESAPNGSKIPLGNSTVTPAQNGLNFRSSIDSELQWMVQQRLATQVQRTQSDYGMAIVMNVKTGEVLAMANAPTFDSSDPSAAATESRGNNAISSPYEPGSVEKVLTSAALFDSGAATPETRLSIPYRLQSGPLSIKDAFQHTSDPLRLRVRGAVAQSSNIGMALATRQMNREQLHDYYVKFGLGSTTGVQLPGESAGIIPPPDMSNIQRDQVAFGQAISVTAVQMAAAISGVVNGGIYHPPTVVSQVTDADGNTVDLDKREPRRIISAKASAQVRDVMQAVMDSDNGQKNLRLDDWTSGGKTGTAQRADPELHRYKGYVTSFVGFAPLNDPEILTYVVMNNPKGSFDTGTSTANPVWRDVMKYALPHFSVAPDAQPIKPKPTTW